MPIPRIDDFNDAPTIPSAAVFRTMHAMEDGARLTDEDGNKFRVWRFNFARSNVSRAYVTKHTRDNVFVAHWQVVLTDNFKHDSVGLDYSGTDLLVIGTGHDTTEGGSRDYEACEAVIPGVFVNRGGGLLPGRGGASIPLEPEPQEGEPVDYERIIRDFATALGTKDSALQVAMSKLMKNNAQIGAANALNESYATTEGSFYKGNGPFARFRDTVWEQVHKVMRERGVGTEPPPPPEPKDGK